MVASPAGVRRIEEPWIASLTSGQGAPAQWLVLRDGRTGGCCCVRPCQQRIATSKQPVEASHGDRGTALRFSEWFCAGIVEVDTDPSLWCRPAAASGIPFAPDRIPALRGAAV